MALLHFNRDVERLRKQFWTLFATVDENLALALKAFFERDAALAGNVMGRDAGVDHMEVEVEEACLKILALHQPVGHDLRYIAALLKINRNLERVGDQAVNIARSARELQGLPLVEPPDGLARLAELAVEMMKKAFDAIIRLDEERAREVWNEDDEADAIAGRLVGEIRGRMRAAPEHAESLTRLYSLVHILERVCDHATNIAKDVLYTMLGEIVRHRGREFKRPAPRPGAGQASENR